MLLAANLLVNRVHFHVAFDLGDRHAFAITGRDHVVEAEDEVEGSLVDRLLIDALRLALRDDDLLHLADHFDVLNDVGSLGCNEDEE